MQVLVTRARVDAERTARRLAASGHEALLSPVIEIVATEEPCPAGAWDAVIVTSAHAVEALGLAMDRQADIYAVGERTGEVLRWAGFRSVMVAQGDAASLSLLIRNSLAPGRPLLHVTGRHHKEEPEASLRAAGYSIRTWEAYEAVATRSLSPAAVEALRSGQIDAALHYSRRSADLFIRLAGNAGLTSSLGTMTHLCLSADVAAPLETVGAPALVAAEPSEDALLTLLDGLP